MSEATTTPAGAADVGDAILSDDDQAVISQPTETAATETEAEATTEETHTDPTGVEESAEAKAEVDRKHDWLKNKGLDPSDPDVLDKVEQKWREAEQGFHQDRQKAKQSIKDAVEQDETAQAITDQIGEDPRIVQLERNQKELTFFMNHPEAKDRQDDIIAVAKKYPKLAADFDLDTLYAISKSEKLDDAVKEAEAKGRQAAKAEIAKSSVAATPAGMASGPSATKTKDPFDTGFDSE
jgi:hypothetical protein